MTVQDVAIFDTEYDVMSFRDASYQGSENANLRQVGSTAYVT